MNQIQHRPRYRDSFSNTIQVMSLCYQLSSRERTTGTDDQIYQRHRDQANQILAVADELCVDALRYENLEPLIELAAEMMQLHAQ